MKNGLVKYLKKKDITNIGELSRYVKKYYKNEHIIMGYSTSSKNKSISITLNVDNGICTENIKLEDL